MNTAKFDKARDAVDPLSTLKFWTDPIQGRKDVEDYVSPSYHNAHPMSLTHD